MRGTVRFVFIVMAFLCAMVGIAAAATVTQNITYQGVLTNSGGTPLSGTYSITFKLYDASSGGTLLGTSIQSVQVSNGQFTTPVTFDSSFFDGRALWLGVKVGADPEMTPRQEIRPVLYALGLRPDVVGASFTTNKAGTSSPGIMGVNVFTNFNWNPGVRITTSGNNSNGVHANTYGAYSEGMYAYTTGTNSGGVVAHTDGDNSAGVTAQTYGHNSDGMYANTYGSNSEGVLAMTHGSSSTGVYAVTEGAYSDGVRATTEGNNSDGLIGVTYGDYTDGVKAITYGNNGNGVVAITYGDNSRGVYAFNGKGVGVYSIGKEGGFFTTNQGGTDWWTDRRPAINVSTVYQYNPGMYVDTLQTNSPGVYSTTHGDNSQGFAAMTYGSGSPGFNAVTAGPNSRGVDALSAQSYGVYGDTGRSDQKYGIYTPDYLYAKGTQVPAADIAEYMPVIEDFLPGTVLVIEDDGRLGVTSTAYDTRVAGIVSTEPGVSLGTNEAGNPGEAQVAVAGRVPCKVDASNGPIHPGDLLTTSDRPGYAMKATNPKIGTILGKALGTLETGTGTIEVLVTLQ